MNRNALLKFHSKTKLRLILIMSKLGQCPHPIETCTPIYWAGDKIPKWGFVCEICMASVYPYTTGVKLKFERLEHLINSIRNRTTGPTVFMIDIPVNVLLGANPRDFVIIAEDIVSCGLGRVSTEQNKIKGLRYIIQGESACD